jgi:aerobic-type carbon monoxide dehydrogenase small subunit (CoxS/CutS family)
MPSSNDATGTAWDLILLPAEQNTLRVNEAARLHCLGYLDALGGRRDLGHGDCGACIVLIGRTAMSMTCLEQLKQQRAIYLETIDWLIAQEEAKIEAIRNNPTVTQEEDDDEKLLGMGSS